MDVFIPRIIESNFHFYVWYKVLVNMVANKQILYVTRDSSILHIYSKFSILQKWR